MKAQHGFTLVELMIVVGILGVLASIAIPLYGDYMTRGKVSEVVTMLGGLRTPMTEFYGANLRWPTVNEVGGKATGNYVSIITSGEQSANVFYVEALMKSSAGYVGGKRLRNYYYVDRDDWECTTRDAPEPIPYQYLPSSCK
jgi:type IV pilus assembly protein PilA